MIKKDSKYIYGIIHIQMDKQGKIPLTCWLKEFNKTILLTDQFTNVHFVQSNIPNI